MATEARVNFAGTYPIPRENSRGEAFWSCHAPIRGHESHQALNFVVNNEEELAEVTAVGVVKLSELTTLEKPYVAESGDELVELTTNIGNIRSRGEW